MKLHLTELLAIGIGFSAFTASAVAQSYTITDLGPGVAYAINDSGEVAGSSPTVVGAVVFSGGEIISLGVNGFADAINNSGQAAGEFLPSNATYDNAFLYSNGTATDINSASLFPDGSAANGINASGQVVGVGQVNAGAGEFHAFLYSDGKMTDIGPPGASQATAYAINASGEVVGTSDDRSLTMWTYLNGKFTELPEPKNSDGATPLAINSNGEIAGEIFPLVNGVVQFMHAGSFSNGVWTDYGTTISGTAVTETEATGINASGQIVGLGITPGTGKVHKSPTQYFPFIVAGGKPVALSLLIPADSGYTLTGAPSINDSGQIALTTLNSAGEDTVLLLTPN